MKTINNILADFDERTTALGWKRRDLLSRCNLPLSTWRRWVLGQTSPQYRILQRLDEVLREAEHSREAAQ